MTTTTGWWPALEELLTDPLLRDELGRKAQARSAEFSWRQSADAMRVVLESVLAGELISGLVNTYP